MVMEIEKLSHEGRGIAHVEGKVVFVDEALPGEQVKAVYRSRRGKFDEAATLEVLRASPHRVIPPCVHAGVCGGCSLQHFDSAAQLAFKEEMLHEKLRHTTGRESYRRLDAIVGPPFGYRRKARLSVRYVEKKAQVLVGFREKLSPFITCMESCEVLDPAAAQLLPLLAPFLQGLDCYREVPQLEIAVGDEMAPGNAVAIVVRHLKPLSAGDRRKLETFAADQHLDLYLQPGGPASTAKAWPPQGPERLYYRLPDFGLTLAFHPLDFTQVNPWVNRSMLSRAIELLELEPGDRVLDLFCGLGNFTLPLAARAAQVIGVEGVQEMVERAYENARANAIANAAFHCADLNLGLGGEEWMRDGFDKVVLDPPRSGAEGVLADVAACRPRKILYISCNPATLARDAGILHEKGYELAAAGVLDMFPQTTHVESMALFSPRR